MWWGGGVSYHRNAEAKLVPNFQCCDILHAQVRFVNYEIWQPSVTSKPKTLQKMFTILKTRRKGPPNRRFLTKGTWGGVALKHTQEIYIFWRGRKATATLGRQWYGLLRTRKVRELQHKAGGSSRVWLLIVQSANEEQITPSIIKIKTTHASRKYARAQSINTAGRRIPLA